MNVSNSITPLKGERLTDIRSKPQWTNTNWEKVEEYVNRLQKQLNKESGIWSKDYNIC
jgi:hypothetical protein